MKKIIAFAFFISLSLVACSNRASETDKFANVYADILVAREMYPDTAAGNNEVKNILAKNGYTMESYKQEFMKLAQDPKSFRALHDTAQARARRALEKLKK